jgi:hypothetical protein
MHPSPSVGGDGSVVHLDGQPVAHTSTVRPSNASAPCAFVRSRCITTARRHLVTVRNGATGGYLTGWCRGLRPGRHK